MAAVLIATAVSGMVGIAQTAHAYISVRTDSNQIVRWTPGAELFFRVNETNASNLSSDDVFSTFTTALNRWKQAAFGGFSFLYYQGTDPSRYPNHLGTRYDNSVFFASNAPAEDHLPCGTIGLTQLWFDSSGIATKADVRFNDICYRFTTNPSDTSSQSAIYLGDVATHEFGHVLGLDHSANVESTMTPTAAIEMARPSCDDRAAMVSLYGPEATAAELSGNVVSPAARGIFGAIVTAIDIDAGRVMNSAITLSDGSFRITGLEPGRYALMLKPYSAGANSLSRYYSGINTAVCNGADFQRSFVTTGNLLTTFDLGKGARGSAGTLTVTCTPMHSINDNAENNFESAPILASANLGSALAVTGTFSSVNGSHQYFRLSGQTGTLSFHALTYSLESNTDISLEVLDLSGRKIGGQAITDNVYFASDSRYTNYDAKVSVTLADSQDIILHLYSKTALPAGTFPYGFDVGPLPHYVMTVSRGAAPTLFAANARCVSTDTFGAYPKLGEAPPLKEDDESSSGCFSFLSIDAGGPGAGGGHGSANRLLNFVLIASFLLIAYGQMHAKPLTPAIFTEPSRP